MAKINQLRQPVHKTMPMARKNLRMVSRKINSNISNKDIMEENKKEAEIIKTREHLPPPRTTLSLTPSKSGKWEILSGNANSSRLNRLNPTRRVRILRQISRLIRQNKQQARTNHRHHIRRTKKRTWTKRPSHNQKRRKRVSHQMSSHLPRAAAPNLLHSPKGRARSSTANSKWLSSKTHRQQYQLTHRSLKPGRRSRKTPRTNRTLAGQRMPS